jgi:uncharacterized membrane-anchored protein
MSKLPHITVTFWVMKICATTLGETAGDLVSMTLGVGYQASSLILISIFLGALGLQLRSRTHQPWLYWMVILATSTAGTTLSDMMDRSWALGYPLGAALLSTLLALVLFSWWRSEGTLALARITTRRGELFYWLTILVSNTLGTALGDFLADSSGLGFAGGAALIGSVLALITLAYFTTHASRTLLFWSAFVLTRPFGATIGDVLTKPFEQGGLNLGTIGASGVLLLVLVILIVRSYKKA